MVSDFDTSHVAFSGVSERATDRSGFGFSGFLRPVEDIGSVNEKTSLSFFLYNGSTKPVDVACSPSLQSVGMLYPAIPELLQERVAFRFDIIVGKNGFPAFEAIFLFHSTTMGVQSKMIVSGARGKIDGLLHPHDWKSGIEESLSWKTDLMVAWDRTEQRMRLRSVPRRTWGLRLLLSGRERRSVEAVIGMRVARSLLVPLWRHAIPLQVQVLSGQSSLSLGVDDPDWAPGEPIAIWSDADNVEIHTIEDVVDGVVKTVLPFSGWSADGKTMIAPCRYCLPLAGRSVSRFTDDVGSFKVELTAIHDQWSPSTDFSDSYQDLPVCPELPLWSDGDETWGNQWQALDNETGLIEYDIQSAEPIIGRDAKFLVHGEGRVAVFLAWLSWCAGRARPFWIRSNEWACELAATAASGASTLRVVASGYAEHLAGSAARSVLELQLIDGTTIRRMVEDAEDLGDGTELWTLNSGLSAEVSAANLQSCAWLERSRLSSDEVDLQFATWECVEATIPIVATP